MRRILTAIIAVLAVIAAFSVFPACGGDTPTKTAEKITFHALKFRLRKNF